MSAQSGATPASIRFGVFEFDVLSSELRRDGVRVTIGEQPIRVLQRLLERPGELVTREDLRAILWPGQTFIDDFDQGLNAAVKRLRDLLGDSADNPQFIETVPRRGYRFIGHVNEPEAVQVPLISSSSEPGPRRWTRSRALWFGAFTALVILGGVSAVMWMPRRSISLPAAPTTLPPRVIALTALSGVESFAAFSPDGNSIAFSWNGEKGDNFDIYVKDIGSSGARQLTKDPGRDVSPVWSPDGRQIAFVRFDGVAGRLHITSALTASEVKLSALPPVPDRLKPTLWCKSIDWSLDGYIAAQYEPLDTAASLPNRGIYFVPVEGGAARPVTHPKTPAVDSCPAFSPDGRHLAFARCASSAAGRCDVHVIDLDAGLDATGPTRQLTKEGIPDVTGVAWARDGNSLVFGTRGGTLQTLWRVPVDGSQRPEQINIAGSAAVPAVARTHDRLAFSRDMNDVDLYSFQPGRPSQSWLSSTSGDAEAQFSSDGHRVVFVSSGPADTAEIWTAAADGAEARQLTDGPGRWQGSPRFSPDGKQVAFGSLSSQGTWHIWTIDSDGGSPRQITDDAGDQQVPSWSHDGQWIYFSANSGHGPIQNIWRVPARGGRSEQVSREGSGWFACESADHTKLLYQPVTFRDGPIVAIPTTGGPAQPVVACARTGAFLDTPQGLYYLACGPDRGTIDAPVHLVERRTGRDRIIGTIEDYVHYPAVGGLAVSPDGRQILYTRYMNRGSDLMLIENFR